jgi:hypothetical protein
MNQSKFLQAQKTVKNMISFLQAKRDKKHGHGKRVFAKRHD